MTIYVMDEPSTPRLLVTVTVNFQRFYTIFEIINLIALQRSLTRAIFFIPFYVAYYHNFDYIIFVRPRIDLGIWLTTAYSPFGDYL